jgi:apolipoprotein N-acyltransferase
MANLALAELGVALLERRTVPWKRAVPWLRVGLCAAVPVVSAAYGFVRIPMVESGVEKAPRVRVALVQANMSLLGKRMNPEESLQRHLSLTRGAMQQKPLDLVVWSETSIGGAVDERTANVHYKYRVGQQLPVPTIFGAVLRTPVDDARKYALSNSALVTNAAGEVVGRYDKQFLLGFGEYLPFGDTFPILYEWSPNSGHFSPGTSFEPLPVGKHTVATFICYEDIIPSFVNRIMSNGSPALLVNLTNDAWFGDTTQPWIHLALAKLRAIEQRRFFVRSTNSGVSAFIDPVGRVLDSTPTFSEVAIAEDLRWLEGSTLYRILGDTPWWLVTMASFAMAFLAPPSRFLGRSRASSPPGQGATARPSAAPGPRPSAPPAPALKSSVAPPGPLPAPPPPQAVPSTSEANVGPAEVPSPDLTAALDAGPVRTPTVNPGEYGAFPKPGDKPRS